MRKLLALGVIFIAGNASYLYSAQDRSGSERPALWRSTEVCHTLNHVVLSTRAAHVHQVRVTSATVNSQTSGLFLFNSTATPFGSVVTSTKNRVNSDVSGAVFDVAKPPNVLDVPYLNGVVLNKVGVACIETLWDFLYPTDDPIYPW